MGLVLAQGKGEQAHTRHRQDVRGTIGARFSEWKWVRGGRFWLFLTWCKWLVKEIAPSLVQVQGNDCDMLLYKRFFPCETSAALEVRL
jgi:hypothetical protein